MFPRFMLPIAASGLLVLAVTSLSHATDEKKVEFDLSHIVEVQLGSQTNQMRFFPGEITLNQGERYLLVLTNPSPVTHEFASENFVKYVETEKVKVIDKSGNLVAYVAGGVVEVELLPGGRIEWEFIAKQPRDDIDLFCDIPGHRDAGMQGRIRIRKGR